MTEGDVAAATQDRTYPSSCVTMVNVRTEPDIEFRTARCAAEALILKQRPELGGRQPIFPEPLMGLSTFTAVSYVLPISDALAMMIGHTCLAPRLLAVARPRHLVELF